MKDIIKYLILGVGGYYLYKNYIATGAISIPGLTTSTPASTTTTSTTTVATPIYTNDTKTQIYNLAKSGQTIGWNGLLNGDQWSYYYNKIRGVPGPDVTLMFPNRDRSFNMTIDEWWSGVVKAGMGRLGNYRRAGRYSGDSNYRYVN